jgi:hypothetical protein
MKEVWKDIAGYEGLYQVSNLGRVKSLDRFVPHSTQGKHFCRGHLMVLHQNNAGYLTVNLCKGNRYKSHDIHRLVAIAFIPVTNIGSMEVNHKDENKQNNSVNNLEWVTRTYNNCYGTKIERSSSKIKKPVIQYDMNGVPLEVWESATDAEKSLSGKFTGAISHCLNGKTKTAYGYTWKYKDAE